MDGGIFFGKRICCLGNIWSSDNEAVLCDRWGAVSMLHGALAELAGPEFPCSSTRDVWPTAKRPLFRCCHAPHDVADIVRYQQCAETIDHHTYRPAQCLAVFA